MLNSPETLVKGILQIDNLTSGLNIRIFCLDRKPTGSFVSTNFVLETSGPQVVNVSSEKLLNIKTGQGTTGTFFHALFTAVTVHNYTTGKKRDRCSAMLAVLRIDQDQFDASLVVTYKGKEVYRVGGIFRGELDLESPTINQEG